MVASSTNTYFIGTYTEKNDNIDAFLNKKDLNNRWALTQLTESLLKTKFRKQLEQLKITLKEDFNKNTKSILEQGDIRSRKLGFFHLKTYQNINVRAGDQARGLITFNLTFVQLGEESNRITQDDTFEAQYTHGITILIQRAIDEKHTLEDSYKLGLTKAIEKLLESIIKDKNSKETDNLMSDDILFSIQAFKIDPTLEKFVNEIFGNQQNAQQQLLVMLQESLIKKIRMDHTLDDVVLLYPDILSRYILSNWEEYLIRIKEFSTNSLKNENAQIIIRHIKPACEQKEFDGQNRYFNGYLIQAFLDNLKDTVTKKDQFQSAKAAYSSMIARIILPIKKNLSYDILSTPNDIKKDIKMFVGQSSEGYVVANTMDDRRDYEVVRSIRYSIDELSDKLVNHIKALVKQRKNTIFVYENFCKE